MVKTWKNTYKLIDLVISKIDIIKNSILETNDCAEFKKNDVIMLLKEFKFNGKIWKYSLFTYQSTQSTYASCIQHIINYNILVDNLMEQLIPKYINVVEKETMNIEGLKLRNIYKGKIQSEMYKFNKLYVNIKVKK